MKEEISLSDYRSLAYSLRRIKPLTIVPPLRNLYRDRTWGPRGYRYAMLAAGRLGQTIYLGATALGLGCCGIGALYDEEARQLLGLNKKAALLYLVAAGPVKRL